MHKRDIVALLLAAISIVLVACGGPNPAETGAPETDADTLTTNPQPRGTVTAVASPTSVTTSRATAVPERGPALADLAEPIAEPPPPGAQAIEVISGLDDPVGFVAAPDGRIFFTEKVTGNVRVIVEDELLPEPVLTLPVGSNGEQGLIGIALDPDFETNHYIWVTHTLPARENNGDKVNRVVRFTEQENVGVDVTPVLTTTNSAGDGTHNAGNLAFGHDGMLYLTLGDDNEQGVAQWVNDPRGKILRYRPTVPLSAPEDNPFFDGDGENVDGIYAFGFRNPFDLVVDPLQPDKTVIFATENGPSCEDEINLVQPGNNYGWHPEHDCDIENGRFAELNSILPLLYWSPTTAPTGITVYTGDDFPEWYGDLFFCSFIDAKLHRLELNSTRDAVLSHHTVDGLFCQTDVFTGPEGELYYVRGGGYGPGTLKRLVRQ